MVRWNLSIADELDRDVRMFLARRGVKKGDLSAFVTRACRNEVMRQTVAAIREENSDLSAEEAMKIAREAVAAARATDPAYSKAVEESMEAHKDVLDGLSR